MARWLILLAVCVICVALLFWRPDAPPPSFDDVPVSGASVAEPRATSPITVEAAGDRIVAPLLGDFRVVLRDRRSGHPISSFTAVVVSLGDQGEIADAQPFGQFVVKDGVGTGAIPDEWLGRCVWLLSEGYVPASIQNVQRNAYDVATEPAATQTVRMLDVDGAPIVGAVVAISRSSFDSTTSQWGREVAEPAANGGKLMAGICGDRRGAAVFASRTDERGDAHFTHAAPGVYWIDYNRARMPYVRGQFQNPYQVTVPSPPVVAQFVPLGAAVVSRSYSLSISRAVDRARLPLSDYEGAEVIEFWRRHLEGAWEDARVWVGPCTSLRDCSASFLIAHHSAGLQVAELPVVRVDKATPVELPMFDGSAPYRSVRLEIVDSSGRRADVLEGERVDVRSGDYVIATTIGDRLMLPPGQYEFRIPGLPEGALAARQMVVSQDGVVQISLTSGWRAYTLKVLRTGTPVASFGVGYRAGNAEINRGFRGAACRIWSREDDVEVRINHRGNAEVRTRLSWSAGEPDGHPARRFVVSVE